MVKIQSIHLIHNYAIMPKDVHNGLKAAGPEDIMDNRSIIA
jgi:hypothetical protein